MYAFENRRPKLGQDDGPCCSPCAKGLPCTGAAPAAGSLLTRPFRQISVDYQIPLPIHSKEFGAPTKEELLLGDRCLEHACEGMVRINQELMAAGAIPNWHPYDSRLALEYRLDPPGHERWSNAQGTIKRRFEDCETLSAYLAAWYRYQLGWDAHCAIYPSVVLKRGDGSTVVGRHVVVFVGNQKMPPYSKVPWDSTTFVRASSSAGFIEDPSIALGMNYVLPEKRAFPKRTPFLFNGKVPATIV